MPTYRTKLTSDAFDKGQEHDTGVSIFESKERWEQRQNEDGTFDLRKREFDRLRQLGLVEDSQVDPAAEAWNPDLDDDNQRTKTLIPRLPQRTTAVHPGGVGHQPNDAYSNRQVQKEIARDAEQAARQARERGTPEQDSVLEASRRSDGHLPEQVKEHEKAQREHEQAVEKARKDAEKDREKARREHEKQEEKDQREAEKERRERSSSTQEQVNPPSDKDTGRNQGQGLPEDQNADARGGDRGESKANQKSKAGGANKDAGAVKDNRS